MAVQLKNKQTNKKTFFYPGLRMKFHNLFLFFEICPGQQWPCFRIGRGLSNCVDQNPFNPENKLRWVSEFFTVTSHCSALFQGNQRLTQKHIHFPSVVWEHANFCEYFPLFSARSSVSPAKQTVIHTKYSQGSLVPTQMSSELRFPKVFEQNIDFLTTSSSPVFEEMLLCFAGVNLVFEKGTFCRHVKDLVVNIVLKETPVT